MYLPFVFVARYKIIEKYIRIFGYFKNSCSVKSCLTLMYGLESVQLLGTTGPVFLINPVCFTNKFHLGDENEFKCSVSNTKQFISLKDMANATYEREILWPSTKNESGEMITPA